MATKPANGSALEVFAVFLQLGLTSFGGPTAHLGFFRDEFVGRRKWFSEKSYADLVALCQFLPGPASSQVGMAVGLQRAGFAGMLAAWVAFTMPSALALVLFALGLAQLGDVSQAGWLVGLKAAAVAVVAHAVLGMTRSLITDKVRAGIALAAFVMVLLVPTPFIQVGAIAAAMIAGAALCERVPDAGESSGLSVRVPKAVAGACLAAFVVLLAGLPLLSRAVGGNAAGIFDTFYRAGALVFGGGHVVLPLLEGATVPTGMVGHDTFLAGYGAAQAVPGPLFTFASFLGASASGVHWLVGASVATVAIFLPAALLVLGVLPFFDELRRRPLVARAIAGANAAVVGILGAALYTPVFTSGVTGAATMSLAAAALTALQAFKVPAWAVVIGAALIGWALL
ncbi:chromate efflux transporter [Corynebacterium liangguodongii]|uniref:Chromate transporter n=1 Tax=Corynebacterium liangguodongii TaxID=2079535 RepID=A0A2S0WDM6_9CORY|nr:chromate efflux transporter [Corynebacterium liangguodongii]AWB83883.1 chromate transporter [Corynebacterium liangguodongii]PWB99022.1 chromate transporter [Corynebacterium liangguodongii]